MIAGIKLVEYIYIGWTAQYWLQDGRLRNSHPRFRYFRDREWRHGNDEIADDCCDPHVKKISIVRHDNVRSL